MRDRGSVSGFVVVITMTILCCAGLAVDGARVVAAKVLAADHAENAARAGAQQVISVRDGSWALEPVLAQQAATGYLLSKGVDGTATVSGSNVIVTVSMTVDMTLLRLAGVSTKSVTATRSSVPFSASAPGLGL